MAKVVGAIVVAADVCKGCELCVGSCPQNIIGMTSDVNIKGYHYAYMVNPAECTGCANCGIVCPDAAITVYRKKIA